MQTFNIFKPDMCAKPDLLEFYLDVVKVEIGVEPTSMFIVPNWTNVSKILYELDVQSESLTLEEIKAKRKQIITSIKAYEHFYEGAEARVAIFDIYGDLENYLKKFYTLKKDFRREFVYNEAKHFVKFSNESEFDFTKPLTEIPHELLKVDFRVTGPEVSLESHGYNLAFFNKVHSPDPDIELVCKEMMLLREAGVFREENRLIKGKGI